jgi:hypothetical protein
MNLDHIDGHKRLGLAIHRAGSKVAGMLARLPEGYQHLLSQSDGIELASGALIYGSQELVERNQTYQVSAYMPAHVAIGDDGGGQMFLLRYGVASPVLRIDMGAIGSLAPDTIAKSIEDWIDQGCPVKTPAELREPKRPSVADVLLDAIPEGKLANLLVLKEELDLNLSITELKKLVSHLPAPLLNDAPYAWSLAKCERLNSRFGTCLSLKTK